MGYLSQFKISFSGLSQGLHEYNYLIDDKFFEEAQFSGSDVKKAKINLNIDLVKQSGMLTLTFKFVSEIQVTCDRCLNDNYIPVNGVQRLIVKFAEEREYEPKDDDEVLILAPSETELDIAQYIYEYINLLMPYQRIPCEILNDFSLCNQEVIEKLTHYQSHGTPAKEEIDPRWEALKSISSKKKNK